MNITLTAIPVQAKPLIARQCGTRHNGATYIATDKFEDLETIREFLLDQPEPVANLSAQGLNPIIRPGTEDWDKPIYDFYDVIGMDSYPNMWDFIEEAMEMGISRKIPKNLFGLVTPGESMHIMVHPKAIVSAYDDYMHTECACGESMHLDPGVQCISRARWNQEHNPGDGPVEGREYMRRLECGREYKAAIPNGTDVEYQAGAFMWMPITRFEVIHDAQSNNHLTAMSNLLEMGFDFDLVDN